METNARTGRGGRTLPPAARPSAADALRVDAAAAAQSAFQERARAFGGVDSNVRGNAAAAAAAASLYGGGVGGGGGGARRLSLQSVPQRAGKGRVVHSHHILHALTRLFYRSPSVRNTSFPQSGLTLSEYVTV